MVFAFAGDSTMTKFLGIVIYDTLISACKSREKRHYIMYRLIKKRIPPRFGVHNIIYIRYLSKQVDE